MVVTVSIVSGFDCQIQSIGMHEEQPHAGIIDIPVGKRSGSVLFHQFLIMKYGLHTIEQIPAVHFICDKLTLSRLEIFCGEQAEILLPGGLAKEIFPYSGTAGYRRAVSKIKIVFIIHMHVQNIGCNIFYLIPPEQSVEMTVGNRVQHSHGTV